ncbi:MAG: FtsW/RodA/SpoVE family cell cycle protein [Leadbetterella sp.]
MDSKVKIHLQGDKYIWYILFGLAIISTLVVYSAISALAFKRAGGNTELYLLKHIFFLACGLFATYIIHRLDFSKYLGYFKIFLWLCIPLLFYTYKFGVSVGGVRRWIGFMGITIQTSDIVRLVLITNLSAMLAKRQNIEYKPIDLYGMLFWIISLVGILSLTSFSTSIILGLTCFVIMWMGRVPKKYLMGLVFYSAILIVGLLLASIVVKRTTNIEMGRLSTVIDRTEEFIGVDLDGNTYVGGEIGSTSNQKNYALMAIASGGVFGKGPGRSAQKQILPDAFSDFAFSALVEEYGMIGGLITILLYLCLFYRGIANVDNTTRAFTGLLSVGLTLSVVLQAFAHMIINVGLVPVTGQTLPLVSQGGTSTMFTCIALGIVLSVTKSQPLES